MSDRIIKAGTPTSASGPAPAAGAAAGKVVRREAYEARLDARDIVDDAQRQAREVLEQAERERQSLLGAAREEGYRAGLAQWNDAVAAAAAARDKLDAGREQQLARLAVRIAEKIIGEELRTRPETIAGIVREALESVRREKYLTIKVHPDFAEEVRRRLSSLEQAVGAGREIHVFPDVSVEPGGCIVESELGIIDARLETQLKCLEEALLRAGRR